MATKARSKRPKKAGYGGARISGLWFEPKGGDGPLKTLRMLLAYTQVLDFNEGVLTYASENMYKHGSAAWKRAAAEIRIDLATGDLSVHKAWLKPKLTAEKEASPAPKSRKGKR